jgi:hypothetical protein
MAGVTIDSLITNGLGSVQVSPAICKQLLDDSAGTAVGGAPPGHADMHQLGDDGGFGHLPDTYRLRERHSLFTSPRDSAIALYAALTAEGGKRALLKMKAGRATRVTIMSVAEPGATMRVSMEAPFMPAVFDYDMASTCLVLDLDTVSRRLHVQTFYPVDQLSEALSAGAGGVRVNQTISWNNTTEYYSGPHLVKTHQRQVQQAQVNLSQYRAILR